MESSASLFGDVVAADTLDSQQGSSPPRIPRQYSNFDRHHREQLAIHLPNVIKLNILILPKLLDAQMKIFKKPMMECLAPTNIGILCLELDVKLE